MTDRKPIPYGRQHISDEDIEEVVATLKSDFLTQGPKIAEFEKAFSGYVGARYALAVANGTAALHLSALALNVSPGKKVITTPITFAASANCIRYCGGEVVFADIDPQTALLDIKKVRALLENAPPNTYQGIIPVDMAGYPVNLESYKELAEEYGLWIIEDACHAPGGFFRDSQGNNQFCGNGRYADLSVFSFHPVKHIACGEGGMITTNRKDLYDRLCLLRTHGITRDLSLMQENQGGWYYEMQTLGFNYRLTDFQAALGSSQLKRAGEGIAKRISIARKYDQAFSAEEGINISICRYREGHAYHLYIIQVKDRIGLYNYLREHNVFAQVHYTPVHLQPYYRDLGWKTGDMPEAEDLLRRLPEPSHVSYTDGRRPGLCHQEGVTILPRMSINDKIGLGTVQFGLKYGINNTTGQIAFDTAKEIVRMYCGSVSLPVFDTASAYGTSEPVLGRILNGLGIASGDTVISKFPGDILTGPDLRASFQRTIDALGGKSLYAFIAHDVEAVRKGQGVLEELIRLKEDGLVRKIGISAYFPSQVEWFLERKIPLELVQVPYNVFDRRFEPFLAEYAAAGIEVHTRSAFLQGLFFRSPDTLPDFFDPVKDNLSAVRSLAYESGLSLSKLLLLFCVSRPDIDRVIIGVDSEKNMQENLFLAGDQEIYYQVREKLNQEWHTAENILLPFNWPKS